MSRTRLYSTLKRCLAAARIDAPAKELLERENERLRLTRREALRASAALATVSAVPVLGTACGDDDDGDGGGARVAIVGGGTAGLHCAVQLARAGVRATVYEAGTRTGGRMFTTRDGFQGGQLAELGGELVDTGHACIQGLAAELGLGLDDLEANGAGLRKDTWWLGGRLVTEDEIVEAFRPLAPIMSATVEEAEADDAVFEQVDAQSITEWLDAQPEADDLIKNVLVSAYVGEYGLECDEQSIFNLLYLIDYDEPDPFRIYGDSDEVFHIHQGSGAIPDGLAAEIEAQIETSTKLVRLEELASGKYRLTFERDAGTVEEEFDHVVLALPFSVLREVEIVLDMPPDKRAAIDEIGYGTNAKIMGQFARRVWREDHGATGSTTTDSDLQTLWDTARGQDGAQGMLTNFLGGRAGADSGAGTPEERLQAAFANIDEIFPGTSAEYIDGTAVRMHWPTVPTHKGSYACYRPGQWAFYGLEGARVGNVHFAGEHCSLDFQGYMEGACETGAMAAQEILDDLGLGAAAGIVRLLGPRLYVPQASYHGRMRGRPRWMQRRRIRRGLR